jgi:hypothetical protein
MENDNGKRIRYDDGYDDVHDRYVYAQALSRKKIQIAFCSRVFLTARISDKRILGRETIWLPVFYSVCNQANDQNRR